MNAALSLSNAIKRVLERVAFLSGWLLILLMFVTCLDVFSRKFGIPIPLTKFQEFEWHLHTAIFSMWMGYNYTINAHPRVDSFTERLEFRTRAWIELVGCILFALPYTVVLVYHGWDFVLTSYLQSERSEQSLGLGYRWIIKAVLYVGLWLILAGIVSVILRLIVYLFGRRPQDEVELPIGHAALEV